jgi:hypothetical protein
MPRTAATKTTTPKAEEDPLQRVLAQLLDMRRQLVERLDKEFDGGDMSLLGSVQNALAGVEAELAARS